MFANQGQHTIAQCRVPRLSGSGCTNEDYFEAVVPIEFFAVLPGTIESGDALSTLRDYSRRRQLPRVTRDPEQWVTVHKVKYNFPRFWSFLWIYRSSNTGRGGGSGYSLVAMC